MKTPDPENLGSASPSVVHLDDKQVYVADARVRDNGWLWFKQWDGSTAKVPPHRVQTVQRIRTERCEPERDGGVGKVRVVREDWRERAHDIGTEAGPTPVVADD